MIKFADVLVDSDDFDFFDSTDDFEFHRSTLRKFYPSFEFVSTSNFA